MPHRADGFTLIELAMTVAIAGILAGVAVPPLGSLLEQQRGAAAASALVTHMQSARLAAVTRNRRAVLCPSADGRACLAGTDWSPGWMLFVDDDGNRRPDSNDDILRVDLAPSQRPLRIASTAGRQQLRYLPDGTSSGSNLTLSICGASGTVLRRVIVNNIGRPRSERPPQPMPCPV